MQRFGTEPRDGFAASLALLRASPNAGRLIVALSTFSDTARMDIEPCLVKLAHVPEVIHPLGNTRLYGTVRAHLAYFFPEYLKGVAAGYHSNVGITVYTDGEDTASSEEDQRELKELAAVAREAGWDLYTKAFGIDAVKIARSMGFPEDSEHAVSLAATRQAVREATVTTARTSMRASYTRPITMVCTDDDPSKPSRK